MLLASLLLVSATASPAPLPCVPRELGIQVAAGTPATEALAKLPEPTSKDEAACRVVLQGRIAHHEGRLEDAATAYQSAAKTLKPLAAALAVLEAEALAEASAKAAETALRKAKRLTRKAPSPLRDRVLIAKARSVEKFGSPKEILSVARTLLKTRVGSAARALSLMHAAQIAQGNVRGASASLRKLLVEHPEHPLAKKHESKLDASTLLLDADEAADRIMGLIQASRMARAEKEALAFDRKRAPIGPTRFALEVATTQALVRAGRADEAVTHISGELVALETAQGKAAVPDEWLEARAWALGKAKRFDAAQKAWQQLSVDAEDDALKTEACFLGGFLAYEVDRFEVAEREWQRCAPLLDGHSRGPQALWYRALMDISTKKRARAIKRLRALKRVAPRDRESDKHAYWLATSLHEGGTEAEQAQAKKMWRALAKGSQTTYYAMLSRRRLGQAPPKGVKIAADALTENIKVPKRISLLYQLGLDDMAQAYAKTLGRKRNALGVQQWVGDAYSVWRRGGGQLPYPRLREGALTPSAGWRASYATPWRADVDDAIEAHTGIQIPPSFAYAIMRTESGFQPDALSVAGALGLLQLMPYTAVGIAKAEGLAPVAPSALTTPKTNIILGMHFLTRLKREFGSTYLAAAAYNGDPRNVADWMRRFEGLDVELFVERVPFKETRNYIKKVTATEAIYRALDGDALALDLPTGTIGPPPKTFTAFKFTDDGDDVASNEAAQD